MRIGYKVLLGAAAVAILVGLGFVPIFHDQTAVDAAHENTLNVEYKAKADYAAEIRKDKIQFVYLHYGERTGDLYAHCVEEPPALGAHQKRCEDLIARVEKKLAAGAAQDAKDKAKW